METLKEFMLLFRFQPDFSYRPTEEEEAKMHQQWGAFIGKLAMHEKLVSTYRLGFEGKLVTTDKQIAEGIHLAEGQTVSGNMVIKAKGIDEAVGVGKECPILNMGGTVEVREILPMN